MKKIWKFLLDNSLLLVLGAVVGLVWANINHGSYEWLLHLHLDAMNNAIFGTQQFNADGTPLLDAAGNVVKHFDLHYLINDLLMAFFFMSAGKEVFEATLPGGALHEPKKAATPLIATAGGVLGPIVVFCLVGMYLGPMFGFHWAQEVAHDAHALQPGWAIPTATDIAFSAMVARVIFGGRHPAVPFLLLLAIADDAVGLVIIALFYGQGDLQPLWLLGSAVAMAVGYFLFNKKLNIQSPLPYFLLMLVSWACFGFAGIHTSLGFIPIVVCMPHAAEDDGVHSEDERSKTDTLNRLASACYIPTELILGLFGFVSAGVVISSAGFPTVLVMASLMIGKTIGIFLFGGFSAKILRFGLPGDMNYRDLITLGATAGIGFTVALFVAGVAYLPGPTQDAAKLGALLSLCSSILAYILAKMLGVKRRA